MSQKRIGGTLRNWILYNGRIHGDIYGDKYWPEGHNIITSQIVSMNADETEVETRNTIYKLEHKVPSGLISDTNDYLKPIDSTDYAKLYIVVRSDVPAQMVPVLVAHTILQADERFSTIKKWCDWFSFSFRKVIVSANPSQFAKLQEEFGVDAFSGSENTTCNGEKTCLIPLPVLASETPKNLRKLRLWKP